MKMKLNLRTLKDDVSAHVLGKPALRQILTKKVGEAEEARIKAVVKQSYQSANDNLKRIYKTGVEGASEPRHRLGIGAPTGSAKKPTVTEYDISVAWLELSEKYREAKESTLGDDKFMLYKGKLAGLSGLYRIPRLTSRSEVESKKLKTGKNKGQSRVIKFRVVINTGTMPFPLDDLVRRPLLLGKKAEEITEYEEMDEEDPANVIVYLEHGTKRKGKTHAPARPFVRKMALKLNELMRSRIYDQR